MVPREEFRLQLSKGEIEACSDETRYWIRGYLAGNMPEPPRDADGDRLPGDDPVTQRWRQAADLFLVTGIWKAGDPGPCSGCGEALLPSQPGFVCAACQAKSATVED